MKNFYVRNHLGLGDHLICIGLYRSLAMENEEVVVPARSSNYKSLSFFLRDLENVRIIQFPSEIAEHSMNTLGSLARKIGYEDLRLGHWGINFMNERRFDESFYLQAGIPFENRWSHFKYRRDKDEEKELMESYDVKSGNYIFLHEDITRNFRINRDLIQGDLEIVEPRIGRTKKSLASYRLLIENAAQVHVIESSFAAFVESFDVSGVRFAHRYARPEATNNPLHEFTYLHNWTIYTSEANDLSRL